ncbi:MAG: DUF3473 domain-containing protein [bacterium]|nr:DUF3473 domain-containing protein [bacterium]
MADPVSNALSFDVEEWFQAEVFAGRIPPARWGEFESRCGPQTEFILGLLGERGVRATFFVLGLVAERLPSLVRRIADAGHELACHGYDHTMITRQTPEEFRDDVRRAKAVLEDLGGTAVAGYRAPTFSVTAGTRWALDVLLESGFLYDASVYPIRHDRYGIPSAPRFPHVAAERGGRRLWEFPGPTLRLAGMTLPAAGGGYLRLFPCRWSRMAIRRANRAGRPLTVFAHPWEFDEGLPVFPLPRLARLRHYGGIRGNARKLRRLLGEFRFEPLGAIARRLEGGGR